MDALEKIRISKEAQNRVNSRTLENEGSENFSLAYKDIVLKESFIERDIEFEYNKLITLEVRESEKAKEFRKAFKESFWRAYLYELLSKLVQEHKVVFGSFYERFAHKDDVRRLGMHDIDALGESTRAKQARHDFYHHIRRRYLYCVAFRLQI